MASVHSLPARVLVPISTRILARILARTLALKTHAMVLSVVPLSLPPLLARRHRGRALEAGGDDGAGAREGEHGRLRDAGGCR